MNKSRKFGQRGRDDVVFFFFFFITCISQRAVQTSVDKHWVQLLLNGVHARTSKETFNHLCFPGGPEPLPPPPLPLLDLPMSQVIIKKILYFSL